MEKVRTKADMIDELVVQACFIAAALVFIPLMLFCMPGGRFPRGSAVHDGLRLAWWTCMAVNAFLLVKKTSLERGSMVGGIMGSLLVVVLGPVSILTFCFLRLARALGWR